MTHRTSIDDIRSLLGNRPDSSACTKLINRLSDGQTLTPERQDYSDVIYINHRSIGLSLCCEAAGKGKIVNGCPLSNLVVESVDLYNETISGPKKFARFAGLPFTASSSEDEALLDVSTTAKDLVSKLGEPSRKGGPPKDPGLGSRWSIIDRVWLEWSTQGLYVSFKASATDSAAIAPSNQGIWDRSAGWTWVDAKIFSPAAA